MANKRRTIVEEDQDILNDPTEFLALKSRSYLQLNLKFENLKSSIIQAYHQLIAQCLDFKQVNVPQSTNLLTTDRKGQLDAFLVLQQMQTVMDICMNASKNICNQLTTRDQSKEGLNDDYLIRLEKEIRSLLRSEEKLKIYIECAQLRVNECKVREKELEEEIHAQTKLKSTSVNKKKTLQKKKMNDSIESAGEVTVETYDNYSKVRVQHIPKNNNYSQSNPSFTSNINPQPNIGITEPIRNLSRTIMSATQQKLTTQSSGNGQISLQIQLTKENQMLKTQVKSAYKGKQLEQQKLTFDLRRQAIRVEDLEKENKYLKKEINEVTVELRKMKDEKSEEEKQRWHIEAVSDQNPHLVDYYRKKMDEKDKDIHGLTKNIKKFAIVEKKLLVKEKAFEVERSDYQDTLLYLNNRVSNISKELGSHQRQVQNKNTRIYNLHEDN